MKIYSFDDRTVIGFANDMKERIIAQLEREGFIDPELRIAERYAFVLASRGVLGALIDKLWKSENDDLRIAFVQINVPGKDKDLPSNKSGGSNE